MQRNALAQTAVRAVFLRESEGRLPDVDPHDVERRPCPRRLDGQPAGPKFGAENNRES